MQKSFIIAIAATLWTVPGLAAPADQKPSADSSDDATLLLIIPQRDDAAQAETPSVRSEDSDALSQAPSATPDRESKEDGPPAAKHGENTLTADEAKSKLELGGFAVSELKKTDDGLWIGKAQREGQSFDVAVDANGNIFFRQAS